MEYLSKNNQLSNNRPDKGRKDEKKLAKKFGLNLTLNSGAINNDGDFSYKDAIWENKCGYKSLMINKWINKLNHQSRMFAPAKKRILSFDSNGEKWVCLPLQEIICEKKLAK